MLQYDPKMTPREHLTRHDAMVIAATTLTLALTTLDFLSHPTQGIANLETRRQFVTLLGPWIKYIGNFGFSVALGIGIATASEVLNQIDHPLAHHLDLAALATGLTLNPTIESFPRNNEFMGDMSFGTAGILAGYFLGKEAYARIRRAHALADTADTLFPLSDIATSADALFPSEN